MGRTRKLVVSGAFFLSGAAGLVYQVVWSRLLNEVFGISAHATTAVLATYLGGLALGGWTLGRFADRDARPLRLYGLLELGVAATAVAGAWLVRAVEPAHAWAATRLAPDSLVLLGLRVLLASAVVLPPTFLMGATLPAMTRAFVDRIGRLGRALAFLYALNTAGAVAGSVAAGFALIRALGVHATLWLAVALNVAVGAAALLLSRAAAARTAPAGAGATDAAAAVPAAAPEPRAALAPRGARWLLAAMALSGFASLSLEVLWTRMLVLVLGTSTYAFATMLTSFLVGIAAGSWLARPWVDRLARPRRAFGWLQVAIAATTLATLPLVRLVIAEGTRWTAALGGWAGAATGRFALSFLVMIVPTTLIGATFPLAARIWARELDRLGARLGQVYGANTLGNVLGAVGGGFVLLPLFGVQRGIALLVIANLAAAGLALLPGRADWGRPRALLPSLPVLGGLWTCAALLGVWHPAPLPTSTGDAPGDPLRYYREGLVSTVSVFQRASDGRQLVMKVDGITIGQSAEGVDRKQQFLAHAPFLVEARPLRRVLSIGLGTGILTGEVAKHPGVERVDCVELSPTVVEAARLFSARNGGVFEDPRVRIVNDDAVSFLRRSGERWDAIVSDGKSIAGHAGNAVFYSEDFLRSAAAHLAPRGVFVEWVPLDVTSDDLGTIVRTFTAVFPHAYLWLGTGSCFLVGLAEPLALDLAHVASVLDGPAAEGLRRHGWRRPLDVAALLVADGPALARWAGDGPLSSIEHPYLEFHALDDAPPAPARIGANLAALSALRRAGVRDGRVIGADEATAAASAAVGPLLDGLARAARGDAAAAPLLEAALARAPADASVLRLDVAEALFELGRGLDVRGRGAEAEALYAAAARAWPELVEAWINLGRLAGLRGSTGEARALLERAVALNPLSGSAHAMLGRLLEARGDAAGAVAHLREAVRLAPSSADLHEDLGVSLAMNRRTGDALAEFREALRLAPDWPAALDRVALLLATDPDPRARDPAAAVRLADRAVALTGGKDAMTLEVAAAAYAAAGRFADAEGFEAKVLDLALASGDRELAGAAREALELYRRRLPLPAQGTGAP